MPAPAHAPPQEATRHNSEVDDSPVAVRVTDVPNGKLADPLVPGQADEAEARAFTHSLARQLGLATDTFMPGYEDALYYLWKEGNLPANVDVLDNDDLTPEQQYYVEFGGADVLDESEGT